MVCLTQYHAQLHSLTKIVQITLPIGNILLFPKPPYKIISPSKAQKLIQKGHLCSIVDVTITSNKKPDPSSVPIVNEYHEVFSDDLLKLQPDREIEFEINLKSGVTPISKTPERMALLELKELKAQIQELLDKKFTRPSSSP